MQFLLLALAASSLALAQGLALYASYPYVYTAQGSALITPTQQQYHSQDVLGQYAYGYNEPLSSKQEVRSLDGITRGTYSYRDAAGKLQTVEYTADAEGFHVAATNLPHAPAAAAAPGEGRSSSDTATDSIEIEAARLRQQQPSSAQTQDLDLPRPVVDTAEVAAAKSIHLKRVASEKLRNEILSAPVSSARSSHVILPVQSVYGYGIPRYYSSGFYY